MRRGADENPYGGPSSAGFNSGTLQLAGEAIKACCGETLTEEDLLKAPSPLPPVPTPCQYVKMRYRIGFRYLDR